MPVLVVVSPSGAQHVVDLGDSAAIVGRDPACDVTLEDPKASARHLRLAPLEAGGWIVHDLGSTHGTRVGNRRILRAHLVYGDDLVVGETRLRFLEHAPSEKKSAGPLVGGTLDLKPVDAKPKAQPSPAPAAAPAPPPPEPKPDPEPDYDELEEEGPVYRPVEGRSLGRALVFVILGLVMVGAVHLWLKPMADDARTRARERGDLRAALENMDISSDTFRMDVEDFLVEHPGFPEEEELIRLVAAIRAQEAARTAVDEELRDLTGGVHTLTESQVRARLLELQRTLPYDEDLAWGDDISRRTRALLTDLERRHDEAEAAALEGTVVVTRALLAEKNPAGALRRLTAFRKAWPALGSYARDRLTEVEDEALAAATTLAERVLETAGAEADPLKRREILGAAWRGLAGTPQGEQIADALRFTRTPGRPSSPGSTPGRPGSTPEVPAASPAELARLAKAAEAEQMVQERRWDEALVALKDLIDTASPGLLQREWLSRSDEVRLLVDLAEALGERAGKDDRKVRVKLPAGRATVLSADRKGVVVELGGETKGLSWPDVPDEDLLPLLTPPKPDPRERLGLAVLAAGLGLRDLFVEILVPLFEMEKEVTEASMLVARHLDGRGEPPPGGYFAYEGKILDEPTYQRRVAAARVAELRVRADGILAKIAKESAFKKLGKLSSLRKELDTRRTYALLAIFNETHYPYPYVRGSEQYRAVQEEIDRRVERVREIWNDPLKVKITRKGTLMRSLDAWDESLAEMRAKGADVSELEEKMAPFITYVTGEPTTIREYALDATEARLFAYNRWVMAVYNPKQDREATEAERQQTRITNDYRIMMGYAAAVTPGPAPYDAIDSDSVVKVLDGGKVVRLVPLRAVRIDDRLVRSSRAHSLDMQRRSFFNHQAPPNPATGEPRTSPFDRMQKAGYKGGGASENIAMGAPSAQVAHDRWCHSSGHHRNILSPWHDLGVGRAGRYWTQNFGTGGGRRPVIEKEDPAVTPGEGGEAGAGDR